MYTEMSKRTKIVIVGGGSAGWLTAGYLSKFHSDCDIELIESDKIPTIGVGESVTPHVDFFLTELGIDRHHWMKHTNSVYKLANKFTNWVENKGETEYFSFNYTLPANIFYSDISKFYEKSQLSDSLGPRTTDVVYKLIKDKKIDRFDKYFNPQFAYMENNKSHIKDSINCLNQLGSISQHINAEEVGNYIKEFVAIPNGVIHRTDTITKVAKPGNTITHLVTSKGDLIDGDIFVDCTGFRRLLIGEYPMKLHRYKNNPINKSIVAQSEYVNPQKELVNYTQSIARSNGWQFKIGLFNRMGNGYCFSDAHEQDALTKFNSFVDNQRTEPREISWTPERLILPGIGNTVAIGLSSGFVEPLEANALYTIITGINLLSDTVKEYKKTKMLDWAKYNQQLTDTIDDIADFLLVHYTLSKRNDTDFWKEMRDIGQRNNHEELVKSKYYNVKNTMLYARSNYSMFPDYMWIQLASHFQVDMDVKIDDNLLKLGMLEVEHVYKKHHLISSTNMNNYDWHQSVIFGSKG